MFNINQNSTPIIAAIIALFCLQACSPSQYYLSPFHANNQPYRVIPMQSDSVKSGTYAGGALHLGVANDLYRDYNINLQGNIHRSHAFNWFNLYYGANVAAGNYHVSPAYEYERARRGPLKRIPPGNRFYAGAGLSAGASIVIPFTRTGSEWRVLGVESSFNQEFGDYLRFRRSLPDSLVTANWKRPQFTMIGITSNPIRRFRKNGETFGVKFGIYFSPERTGKMNYSSFDTYYVTPVYFSAQFHFTHEYTTAFAQVNLGDYAAGFQFGVSQQLGMRKKKPR